jgi:hypothetical protein
MSTLACRGAHPQFGPTQPSPAHESGDARLRALDSRTERPRPIQMKMTRSAQNAAKMRHVRGLTNGDCLVGCGSDPGVQVEWTKSTEHSTGKAAQRRE